MPKAIFEAKHVSAFQTEDAILQRYFPQMQHNMRVCGLTKGYLSVFFGTQKWKVFEIDADPIYQGQLIAAERHFWECVRSGEPPVITHVEPPIEAVRKVDMTLNNAWADAAGDWHQNYAPAKAFDAAAKRIKELIEPDVQEATGHGIKASRSKAGAITIRKDKQ